MANLQVKDGAGSTKYIKASGAGSDVDPHITEQSVSGTVQVQSNSANLATQTTVAAIQTAVEILDNIVSGNEAQVDVVGALPTGTNTIGAALDAGPSVAGTFTYTTSADMSTAADIAPTPTSGQKSVLLQATISTDTAMSFTLQMETTPGAERVTFYLPASGSVIFVPRYPIKLGTADKKWQGKASVAGNVAIHTTVRSEA